MPTIEQRSEAADEKNNSGAAPSANICLQPIPARPKRWMPQRKAEILAAVRRGTISLRQACDIYELSLEEFLTWQRGDALYGLAGLRATAVPLRRPGADENRPPAIVPDLRPETE
jgi:Protein of unknown function (DUF1153)